MVNTLDRTHRIRPGASPNLSGQSVFRSRSATDTSVEAGALQPDLVTIAQGLNRIAALEDDTQI